MGSWPKITLVTPSFNQARFLERTLKSVLDQGYPELEYLVFDGGSTDGSVELLRRYSGKLAHWASEKDRGQADAINRGLRRATGEIVGWLNSDDTLAPGSLFAIASAYRDHPEVDLVYGHGCLIDAEDRVIRRLAAVETNAEELIRRNRNMFIQPGTTWRRTLLDRVGYLDDSLHFTMDCDLWIRAAKNARLLCLPRHLGNLRVHGETKSTTQRQKFLDEQQLLDARYGAEKRDRLHVLMHRGSRALRIVRNPVNWRFLMGLGG